MRPGLFAAFAQAWQERSARRLFIVRAAVYGVALAVLVFAVIWWWQTTVLNHLWAFDDPNDGDTSNCIIESHKHSGSDRCHKSKNCKGHGTKCKSKPRATATRRPTATRRSPPVPPTRPTATPTPTATARPAYICALGGADGKPDRHIHDYTDPVDGRTRSCHDVTICHAPHCTPPPPAAPPESAVVGNNFGRGDCGCTAGSLDPLRTSGIDWLDTAAFDAYAAAACAQASGPYYEARDFVSSWAVDPPHPTLNSQAVLSQSPGTDRYAISASATAPRKAECTAANAKAGEPPTVTTAALACTGAQAHLSAEARTWIAGDLQRIYPGSAVRGTGQHCSSAPRSLRTHFEQRNNELINPGAYETVVRVCYEQACHQTAVDDGTLAVSIMNASATDN